MNEKNPCALITGISGQDGSYLTELLLRKNYKIIGVTRNIETTEAKLPFELKSKIENWNDILFKQRDSRKKPFKDSKIIYLPFYFYIF